MATNEYGVVQKNWLTAFVLSLFLGVFGADRFYLGKSGSAILKLITLGGFGIWALIDFIMIATKSVPGVEWVGGGENDKKKAWTIFGIALFLGIVLSVASAGTDLDSNTSTNTASDNVQEEQEYRFKNRADKQPTDVEVLPGETATIAGVNMTVNSVEYKKSLGDFSEADSGKTFLVANVTVENTSDETQPYNGFNYRVQTAGGQVLDQSFESVDPSLGSGDLVTGGTTTGNVVFEVPVEEEPQFIIWKPGLDPDRAIVKVQQK